MLKASEIYISIALGLVRATPDFYGPVVSPTSDAKVDRYGYKPGAVLQFSGVV